jgi:hypothetical protein
VSPDIESHRSHPQICLGARKYVNGELLAVASVTVSCDYAHNQTSSGWPVERTQTIRS